MWLRYIVHLYCLLSLAWGWKVFAQGQIEPQHFEVDLDLIPWDHVSEYRQLTYQSGEVQTLTLDALCTAMVNLSIGSALDDEDLRQARLRTERSFGRLMPRFTLLVSPDMVPIGTNNFVANLFGPLVPVNWLSWLQQRQFYDAKKAEILDHLITRVTSATAMYYQAHKLKTQYGLSYLFKQRVDELVRFFYAEMRRKPDLGINPFHIEVLDAFGAALNAELAQVRLEALRELPLLVEPLDLISDLSLLDIERIVLTPPSERSYLNVSQVTEEALQTSLNLKMWSYLVKAAQYSYQSSIFGVLSARGQPPEDFRALGFSFGLDTMPNIKITKSQLEQVKVHYREAYRFIQSAVAKLVVSYNESLREYEQLMRGESSDWSKVTRTLRHTLSFYNESATVNVDIHHLEFLHATYMRRIRLEHDLHIFMAMIEQYLVTKPQVFVLQQAFARHSLRRLKQWAQNGYSRQPGKRSRLKMKLRGLWRRK
ncbi:MAG: hypothetical protein OXT67_10640 [Zetaproteobacteria bacterium]|nr:hypothetical protein [Zetaproteobacteria bacterium]